MADTTKLAGTFKAWRCSVQVEPQHLDGALKRCEELGLRPRLLPGYIRDFRGFFVEFQVVVPRCVCDNPVGQFVERELGSFEALPVHFTETDLICPLSPVS